MFSASIPSKISMNVYWEPATVGEESAASTQRAHFVARERSAVGLAMNLLTTTIAKVSQTVPSLPLSPWSCVMLVFQLLLVCSKVIILLFFYPDIDECETSTHNCGPEFECQNTKGSFRCQPKVKCGAGFIQDALGNCIGELLTNNSKKQQEDILCYYVFWMIFEKVLRVFSSWIQACHFVLISDVIWNKNLCSSAWKAEPLCQVSAHTPV